ncbi:conserved hypothetical protein [Curtobacterium sp. 8I-2]|nr:conserved hypothetical protein [Curtobacterium sp. 8I-2]
MLRPPARRGGGADRGTAHALPLQRLRAGPAGVPAAHLAPAHASGGPRVGCVPALDTVGRAGDHLGRPVRLPRHRHVPRVVAFRRRARHARGDERLRPRAGTMVLRGRGRRLTAPHHAS